MNDMDITASFFEYKENQSDNITNCKINNRKNNQYDDIYLKSPYEWTTDEVIKWLNTTPFSHKRKKFKKANINGSKLFTLDRVFLQNDVKIFEAKVRSGILLAIQKLKHEWRQIQKQKTQNWVNTHSNTSKLNKKNLTIKNTEMDIHNNRMYIQIRRNKNTFNDISNYSIQHILDFYDSTNVNKQPLNSIISINNMDLIDCLMDDTAISKHRTVFIFIIQNNTQPKKYIYLLTKDVKQWTVQNVFVYFSKINNGTYDIFAKQLKKKQINGTKLIKYNRKTLRDDFANYTDSLLRKHIYDEIQILSEEIEKQNIPKTYHNYLKPTQSDIEKQQINRQKFKKLGPRDIGNNKHYKQITYSLNENDFEQSFLNERIRASAKNINFRKRKQQNPIIPNETVEQIGNNKHYKQITYQLTGNDLTGGFLYEKIHPLAKEDKFQQKKQQNPIAQKATVDEIGNNKHYKEITYQLTENDLTGGFLYEKIHPLSKEEKFQKRKQQNPIAQNETVDEIGINNHYQGISYVMRKSEITGTFLNENIHPLAKDSNFQKRKQQNPLSLKQSFSDETGMNNHFRGISYEMKESETMGTFLTERVHPFAKDNQFQQRKQQNPLVQKETVEQIGSNKHYIQISYQLRKSQLMGTFLTDRYHPMSKDINFQKRKQINPIIPNETLSEIGTNKHYQSISYELSENELKIEPFKEAFPEKEWYESTKIWDNTGLSWLLKNLPPHKLRIMDEVPLPTGAQTKIVWLRKLRDLITDEMIQCSKKNSSQNIAYSNLLKEQLTELNEMLIKLRGK